jgi:pimeloyl-ACP methyl ester carboxylesterase
VLVRERHEPARRRRLDGVLTRPRVIWVNPSGTEFGGTSIEAFAQQIQRQVDVTLLGLRVWGLAPGERYDMGVEVAAVAETAGSEPVHLAGFSAGATVALAAALALGDAVRSVALMEPAFIGDDDWDPAEAEWRSRQRDIKALPRGDRIVPFRRLLMRPGLEPPPPRAAWRWDAKDDLLERMLFGETGFRSGDLAAVRAPLLAIRGGRSNPRWEAAGRRLAEVCPGFREHVFPERHHFAPPFREEPSELADILLGFWLAAGGR